MAIVKSKDAQRRKYMGVSFERLAIGPQSMVTKMLYAVGDQVPEHSHPNEQSGYVISGKFRLRAGSTTTMLEAGDSYAIPADVVHRFEVLEPGEVIDVFTPPREDFL